ncbi:unnamed protein product [Protopolystoma xenopodis]|uniref:Uncharacterized protein n=1 Tax=Protopolystoma xenopodis TaxID=117903 RepID=A0A3S5CUY2_9PLAT|nr:unnamed protein product [Protopolystoma xenopodis]
MAHSGFPPLVDTTARLNGARFGLGDPEDVNLPTIDTVAFQSQERAEAARQSQEALELTGDVRAVNFTYLDHLPLTI